MGEVMTHHPIVHPILQPMFETLHTERLVLRPYHLDDAEARWQAIEESRDHLRRYEPEQAASCRSVAESQVWIIRANADWLVRKRFAIGIWTQVTNQYLGGIGLPHVKGTVGAFLPLSLAIGCVHQHKVMDTLLRQSEVSPPRSHTVLPARRAHTPYRRSHPTSLPQGLPSHEWPSERVDRCRLGHLSHHSPQSVCAWHPSPLARYSRPRPLGRYSSIDSLGQSARFASHHWRPTVHAAPDTAPDAPANGSRRVCSSSAVNRGGLGSRLSWASRSCK